MATGPNIESVRFDLGVRNTEEFDVQCFGPAPAFYASRNTRLGIVDRSVTRSPAHVVHGTTTGDERRCGLVPSGIGSTLVLARKCNERITTTGHAQIRSSLTPTPAPQDAFYPYDVADYGTVPGSHTGSPPAVAFDAYGRMWTVEVRSQTGGISVAVTVTVTGADGNLIVAPTTLTTAASVPWVGVTCHGTTMVLWWLDGSIKANRATADEGSLALSLGTGSVVYAPVAGAAVAVHSDNHGTYAWLVSRHASNANDAAITRVDVSTWATSTIAVTQSGPPLYVAIRHIDDGGDSVGVVVKVAAGACNAHLINGASMALLWTAAAHAGNGAVAVAFIRELSGEYWLAAASTDVSGTPPTPASGTWVRRLRVADGTNDGETLHPWKGLISNGIVDRDSTGEARALFAMQNALGNNAAGDPAGVGYVSDPSVELYRFAGTLYGTMVARFAVDTALIVPTYLGRSSPLESSVDGAVALVWLDDPGATRRGPYSARYVRLQSAAPSYAIDSDGCAIVAQGAAYWDGAAVSEWCPTSRPVLVAETAGGTEMPGAGTWRLSAVVYWRDGTGQLRRSMPASVVTLTTNGTDQPRIRVTLGASMRDGVTKDGVRVYVYASQDGQTALFGQLWQPSAWTDHYVEFDAIRTPLQRADTPAIYTDGTPGLPLPAQCPPSFQAVAVVGERMWGLSLGELWFSKPKEAGIAFECSSEQRLALPAAAGRAYALAEQRGAVIVLCERGVWAITGQGPDAALGGGAFNPPEQISDLGCTSRHGVVRTPAGIFYVSGRRFAVIGGPNGAGYLEGFDTRQRLDVSTAPRYSGVHLQDTGEVVWYSSDTSGDRDHVVYNYRLQRFTTWVSDTMPAVRSAVIDPRTNQVFLLREGAGVNGTIHRCDPASASEAVQVISSGNIRLNGEVGDAAVQCVLFELQRRVGPERELTVFIGLYSDGATLPGKEVTFTHDDLVKAADPMSDICVLSVAPPPSTTRMIRWVIEVSGSGDARLLTATLVYGAKPGTAPVVRPAGIR